MNPVEEQAIDCPYCGESVTVVVDCSQPFQEYVEDCFVCCRPIVLTVNADPDAISVQARSEDH